METLKPYVKCFYCWLLTSTQLTFTCWKSAIETLKINVRYVKLAIKIPERCQPFSSVSIVGFEQTFSSKCYFSVPRLPLVHYRGLTHPILITAFLHIQPEGHREPRDEVGSLRPVKLLLGFEPGTFRFCLQLFNLPGHSLPKIIAG